MKNLRACLILFILTIPASFKVYAQEFSIDQPPIFPGGNTEFSQYILKNLKYPEAAAIVGLSGKVYINFVVEKDGSVVDVKPLRCLGAGCESEAVRVISMSPKWSPGMQNGKLVRVMYTVPVNFGFTGPYKLTELSKLRKSKYGFVFFINGKTYTVDEVEELIGKSFDPAAIVTVENYDNPKYIMPDKKAVYLIVMKNS